MPAGSLAQIGADAVAGLLRELSAAQITSLFEIIEPALPPDRVTQLDQLVRAAVSATRDGDASGALAKLATLVSLDPRRGEGLASDPALAPIRKEVEALLARLTGAARLGAETRLREAAGWLQAPEVADRPIGNVKPSTLLLLASRLIDAGGYANCIHSAKVSQMVLDERRWAPAEVATPLSKPADARLGIPPATPRVRRDAMAAGLKKLWRRAPLLALLLGWLGVGLAGGSVAAVFRDQLPVAAAALFFEIWTLGFLALAGFGFYMSVRKR
ncbi:MAG: hypothetical protein Q8N47_21610 [Bryobacterales bacterium]|nr:hypothetical protein [Bryobacterales bacterium]